MGPEQTLRRETWPDRREISVCVSFIFKKIQNMTFVEPGHVKQKKRLCEERTTTDPVVGRNPIHGEFENPIHI